MPIYHIYCDESRQTSHRYMVLGGFVIHQDEVEQFKSTMAGFRHEMNMHAELKWQKVSNGKLSEYKRFIDYFFALNNTDIVHFHCVVFDTHQINHKAHNSGNKETGFYKFYYQLLFHCFAKNYLSESNDVRLIIHLDERTTSYKLNDLKDVLNNGIKKHLKITNKRILSVQPVDSKNHDISQIADIILGAIGFQKNGYDLLSGSSKAKIDIADYIARGAGIYDLKESTRFGVIRFKIWNFRFKSK